MANVKLREPEPKKGINPTLQRNILPFEVQRKNDKEYLRPLHYFGHLKPSGVEIEDQRCMEELYNKGYFGKGTLSKSAPTFQKRKKAKFADEEANTETEKCTTAENESLEKLQLMFEEAFFLSYGLGCLIVKEYGKPLSLLEMWQKFCDLSSGWNFPQRYACYHYFRSKGWVVKSGVKYGADFLLYKDGPPFYHATYCVIVKSISSSGNEYGNSMNWEELSGLARINAHIGKDLLFCYVIEAKNADLANPSCISSFKIQEVLMQRWVASEEREESEM